ncbi:FISUMP domain-containing protein [Fibrobacter sp.]|uniref:FISUMP domain-containing protein n=1 Tax=Fibrobacter sp. TaxID=35828 RepID=UPI00388F5A01
MLNMEKNQIVLMRKSLQRSVATAAISLLLLLLAACSGENKTSGGTSEETQIIAIEDRTVAGVSQKGPFLQGSSITVQELDGATLVESGKLYQTGKSFKGKIASDTGTFLIKDISLKSQFALLETEGFYRNEVTGEVSKSQITLNALVDLSEREKANINLLTHLEYERVIELVGSGETISSAKKKAESDVFKAFGIEVDNASAEDLDIFAKGDDNAALLAISILMQGNLSEGNLSNRLAGFASDIEKDGSWDDENEKTDIADWASTADLAKIRVNIRSWELGEDVPAFEKFFKRFWWNNFKLGECDAETAGMTKKNKNELSATYGEDYRCAANEWKLASKTDDGSSGDFSYGSLTDKRDNKTYKTIVIGNQEWMAENLNYAYKAGGSIYGNTCYGGDSDNCIKYGRLYTWGAVMDTVKTGCGIDMGMGQEPTEDCGALEKKVKAGEHVQGICPDGWHLPSHTEILTLFNYVNSITGYDPMAHQTAAALKELINSGKIDSLKKIQIASLLDSVNVKGDSPFNALRAKNDWVKKGTDIVGFSALPAGKCDARTSVCDGKGAATGFWMAGWDEAPTDLYPSDYAGWMNTAGLKVLTFTDGVQWAWTREPPEGLEFSVRCIVD